MSINTQNIPRHTHKTSFKIEEIQTRILEVLDASDVGPSHEEFHEVRELLQSLRSSKQSLKHLSQAYREPKESLETYFQGLMREYPVIQAFFESLSSLQNASLFQDRFLQDEIFPVFVQNFKEPKEKVTTHLQDKEFRHFHTVGIEKLTQEILGSKNRFLRKLSKSERVIFSRLCLRNLSKDYLQSIGNNMQNAREVQFLYPSILELGASKVSTLFSLLSHINHIRFECSQSMIEKLPNLAGLLQYTPKITSLQFSFFENLITQPTKLAFLSPHQSHNLKALSFHSSNFGVFQQQDLENFFGSLPKLEFFSCSGVHLNALSHGSLSAIFSHLPNLRYLSIIQDNISRLPKEQLDLIFHSSPFLRTIWLDFEDIQQIKGKYGEDYFPQGVELRFAQAG